MIKAIETKYKGYRFRSRLEARWAVYFDTIGLKWEYEPQGFDLDGMCYLPDFWFPQVHLWGEVKAVGFSEDELERGRRLTVATGHEVLMLVGTPSCKSYWTVPLLEMDASGIYMISCDYAISNHVLNEGRLWSCPGWSEEMDRFDLEGFPDIPRAVEAARSARFEHGETQ